nr:sigma-54-dependent Fis family transcriptional regulator [candidate division Zixibacteria bacterium]
MHRASDKSARILLVDNDADIRISVEKLLRQSDYEVISAGRCHEAIKIINSGGIDLIITDLHLPDGSGLDIITRAREYGRETAVIIQTRHGSIDEALETLKKGACHYLTKPAHDEELLHLIEKALEYRDIREELYSLREEVAWRHSFDSLIGVSRAMEQIKILAARVAATDLTVLITGEPGTGRELLARTIHYHSARRRRGFVAIDGTILSQYLPDLIGISRTTADKVVPEPGDLINKAHGGTLFIDEIGELSMEFQNSLMDILRTSKEADGSPGPNIRLLGSTARDLGVMVREGQFREDLYYRINTLPIKIPPLRERPEDIPVLVDHFLKSADDAGRVAMTPEAMGKILHYDWPGNIRELENTIGRAIALCRNRQIEPDDIIFINSRTTPETARAGENRVSIAAGTLEDSLKERIEATLSANNWNLTRTAVHLGIGRTTLWRKIRKYNIRKNKEVPAG